jgi:pyruvoyl-dependent arginine decarboxylase (PvlArgDC)
MQHICDGKAQSSALGYAIGLDMREFSYGYATEY